ncbi:MAG TPA: NHL repeat-containing protein [Bacteroidota bacterium]|nr:NHL repeat-containing protein [Bacteroidota bacterium]
MSRLLAALPLLVLLNVASASDNRRWSLDVDINGTVIVVDGEKNVVRQYTPELVPTKEIGGAGWSDDQFDRPAGIWARNGIDVLIADYGNHRIQRFDRQLSFISSFSTRDRDNPEERFGYPTDVALSRLGDLFICDSENARILKVSGLSKVERTFGGLGAGKGRLYRPQQIEVGPSDNVYVQDGKRIVVFDAFGNYLLTIEGLFASEPLIYADERGLVALADTRFFVFDRDDRPIASVEVDTSKVRSSPEAFALGRGVVYILTQDGILTLPDPRAGGESNGLHERSRVR